MRQDQIHVAVAVDVERGAVDIALHGRSDGVFVPVGIAEPGQLPRIRGPGDEVGPAVAVDIGEIDAIAALELFIQHLPIESGQILGRDSRGHA